MYGAASGGMIDEVRSLLDAGADVNADLGYGCTALWAAAWRGHNDVVNLLLDRGANIDAKTDGGWTALFWALYYNSLTENESLLHTGEFIDGAGVIGRLIDKAGKNAEVYAALKVRLESDPELVNALIEVACRDFASTATIGDSGAVEKLMDLSFKSAKVYVALKRRLEGDPELVNALIQGAYRDHGNTATLAVLLSMGFVTVDTLDSSVLGYLMDLSVENAEFYATLKGRLENDPGLVSAFIQAAYRDFASTTTFASLLSMGVVSVDRGDSDGDTPLTLAAANENSSLAEFLLKNGAEATINLENKFGETALSFATSTSNARLATLLRAKGATERKVDENQYPLCGMTFKDLDDFLEAKCYVLEGKTTYDVQLIIKEMTVDCSYCDYIKRQTQANVFISHAWGFLFLDVVATMRARLGSDPDVVFWFDVFSVNQHSTPGENLPFSFWSTVFKGAIMIIGRVLMIFCRYPSVSGGDLSVAWREPLPLLRCWCIFESYCAISSGCTFEVALSVKDRAEFEAALLLDTDLLDTIVGGIDVLKSSAKVEEDKRLILKSIEKYQGGADKINKKLRKSVKEAYGSVDAKGDAEEEAEVCSVLKRVARIQNRTTK